MQDEREKQREGESEIVRGTGERKGKTYRHPRYLSDTLLSSLHRLDTYHPVLS